MLTLDSANPTGRRDFVRSGPIDVTFTPSDGVQDQEISIPLIQDEINEAREGFFAVLEPVDLLDSSREVTLIREGVTLVNIRDDDCKSTDSYYTQSCLSSCDSLFCAVISFGFERIEYFFPEENSFIDSVLVTKNGVISEQTLELQAHASFSGFSQEGESVCKNE